MNALRDENNSTAASSRAYKEVKSSRDVQIGGGGDAGCRVGGDLVISNCSSSRRQRFVTFVWGVASIVFTQNWETTLGLSSEIKTTSFSSPASAHSNDYVSAIFTEPIIDIFHVV